MQIQKNIQIQNTFGIAAKAAYYTEIYILEDITDCLANKEFKQYLEQNKVLVMGSGSNLLFTNDYPGWVIANKMYGIQILVQTELSVIVKVDAGVDWDSFVAMCVGNGWYGLENLSHIPGTVGAAPVQNIGAYGAEVSDVISSIHGVNLKTGEPFEYGKRHCQFAYRNSIFKQELANQTIITSVSFMLQKDPEGFLNLDGENLDSLLKLAYGDVQTELKRLGGASLANLRTAIINIRKSKLPEPEDLGNAGSFFKNVELPRAEAEALKLKYPKMPVYPVKGKPELMKIATGWLIDQCGLKGFRKGNAGVHEKQALVLVNHGGATGNDIVELAKHVQQQVQAKFGVAIEPEVRFV